MVQTQESKSSCLVFTFAFLTPALALPLTLPPPQRFIVTELLKQDLSNALVKDDPSSREWGWYGKGKEVAMDIILGLAFLHHHNVLHRDLKSSK